MGKKIENRIRRNRHYLRLSEDEKQALEKTARAMGFTMSTFIRITMMEKMKTISAATAEGKEQIKWI